LVEDKRMTSMYELHVRHILTSLSAMDVTTTSARQGKFEARFYHKIFAEEIGRVRGHFGPLNYVAVHPQGTSYCSGGEDGYVRVHHFDKPYFDFLYEVEREAAQANL
jgi:translation initiation factor 3 subunit I